MGNFLIDNRIYLIHVLSSIYRDKCNFFYIKLSPGDILSLLILSVIEKKDCRKVVNACALSLSIMPSKSSNPYGIASVKLKICDQKPPVLYERLYLC